MPVVTAFRSHFTRNKTSLQVLSVPSLQVVASPFPVFQLKQMNLKEPIAPPLLCGRMYHNFCCQWIKSVRIQRSFQCLSFPLSSLAPEIKVLTQPLALLCGRGHSQTLSFYLKYSHACSTSFPSILGRYLPSLLFEAPGKLRRPSFGEGGNTLQHACASRVRFIMMLDHWQISHIFCLSFKKKRARDFAPDVVLRHQAIDPKLDMDARGLAHLHPTYHRVPLVISSSLRVHIRTLADVASMVAAWAVQLARVPAQMDVGVGRPAADRNRIVADPESADRMLGECCHTTRNHVRCPCVTCRANQYA